MSLISYKEYKGRRIMVINYANQRGESFIRAIEEATAAGQADTDPRRGYSLVDVTNAVIDKNVTEALKKSSKASTNVSKKMAVIGVTGIKKMLADIISKASGLGFKVFNTEEEALEWLAKE